MPTTSSTAAIDVAVDAISLMAPRRWLWPCSDSQVLRLPAYQKPSLQACILHPEHPDHVLVVDSDHLDHDLHSAKRRRIESIAHAFLDGQPIYIPSATLKGPFPADRDLSLRHDPLSSPDARPVSPPPTVTADSFIRRRPEHKPLPKSISPDPARSRSVKNKSLQFNLPSSAVSAPDTDLPPLPKFVSINQALAHARPTPNQFPTSTAPARSFPSPRVRIPDTDFISPSPSPSKYDISPSKAAVLRQRPASSLNRVEKAPPSAHKLQSVKKNKRPMKRVYQAAAAPDTSPFIYRKNALHARKIFEPTRKKSIEPDVAPVEPEDVTIQPSTTARQSKAPISSEKRHHVLFESSLNVPNAESPLAPSTAAPLERSPERPSHDLVPAINMSFGQESLGMNFDIVNHFNESLPAPSAESGVVDVNQDNQQPPAATVTWNLDTDKNPQDTSKVQIRGVEVQGVAPSGVDQENIVDDILELRANEERGMMPGSAAKASSEVTSDSVDHATEDTVIDDVAADEVADELPYISTQAAMQDAHRALFDASSPVQPQEERIELPVETPAKHATSPPPSPVHAITPFHQFNAEFTTDTQAPLPNTQALFDGFYSPIKLSAQKPRMAKRASFVPSVILEDADDTVASILDFSENDGARENSYSEVDPEQIHKSTTNDQHPSPAQSVRNPDRTSSSPARDLRRPSVSDNSADRSESPDIILSQKPPASTRESTRHVPPALQTESVSLSEMLDFVSKRRGIDVDTLLSQATPTSSSRSTNKNGRESSRSSRAKPRSSLSKQGSSQSKRPRSSLPKSLPERRVGQRRSTRLSLSQPIPQVDGADDDDETDFDIDGPSATQPQLSHPRLSFTGLDNSFALASFGVPDGSSTIPDPSLAFNHAQQNATPGSEKLAMTPGSALQSTGSMSSFQHAQKQYSSLTDLDSTMPDLPQTFLPPVR